MSSRSDVSNIRSSGATSAQSGSVRGGRVYKFQPQKLQVTLNQHNDRPELLRNTEQVPIGHEARDWLWP